MKKIILTLAKQAIEDRLYNRESIDREKVLASYPEHGQDGAVFVMLSLYGTLRGCIGSLVAHRPPWLHRPIRHQWP